MNRSASEASSPAKPGLLGRAIASHMSRLTLEKVSTLGMRNAELNKPRIASGKSVLALRHGRLMEGDTALAMAAGPSLHRRDVGRQLKAAAFKGTLITTESALAYCLRHEIVPDLVVTLDPHPDRIVRWFGDPALDQGRLDQDDYFRRQDMDPNFASAQLRFNEELIRLVNTYGPKLRVAVSSSASQAVVDRVYEAGADVYWWNPFYDDYDLPNSLTRALYESNRLPCLNAGGNVGSACWVIAHAVLEKRKVGLVGMDLSYYPDTPYEKTQYYYELVKLVGHERLDEVFVDIYNPEVGAKFFTDPTYLWYRDSFLAMAQEGSCETYNCTEGGILFGKGVKTTTLTEFFKSIAV